MVHGHCKFMGLRLTQQAHFNPIKPSYPNPNLTKTPVQFANLIMYREHVRTDGRPEWTHY